MGWPWWRSPDRTVVGGGNDSVGEFRLSQASCDEEGDEDRLLELEGFHYSDVEVGYDLPLLVEGCVHGDRLEVDEKVSGR